MDVRKIILGILGLGVFIAVWFWIAGRVDWWQGWIFLLVYLVYVSVLMWRLSRLDPDLLKERNAPADSAEPWDRVVMGVYTLILVLLLILCALDGGRFRWSVVPLWVQVLGWILIAVSGTVVWQVMRLNTYLSSYARLQEERGQVVVQDGLYGFVRHPMYLAIILGMLGIPLALGSWWALIPALVIAGLFVYRTDREDGMLMAGLQGYSAYSQRVKYRLLPWVW